MTKVVAVMLACTTKDNIHCSYNFIFIVHQHGGYIVIANQELPLQHNREGARKFCPKKGYFLSPVCLHGRYSLMGNNGAIG